MKQEIICKKDEAESRKLFPNESPYPGEHVKFVPGKALNDMLCDHCGCEILEGQDCCAVSIWADHGAQPYYEWESKFIEIS